MDIQRKKNLLNKLSEKGVSLGILDAPFVKPIGLQNGFEVVDWGPHDSLGQGMTVQPPPFAADGPK